MTSVTIDLERAPRIGLAEAKAGLSGVVARAEETGVAQVIMRYGRPVAAVVALPQEAGPGGRARGLLAAYADAAKAELEEGAFARAMAVKHGNPA